MRYGEEGMDGEVGVDPVKEEELEGRGSSGTKEVKEYF